MSTHLGNDPKAREARSVTRVVAVLRQEAQEQRGTPIGRMWRELAAALERDWPQGPRRIGDPELTSTRPGDEAT
jgi:hypothetical protein